MHVCMYHGSDLDGHCSGAIYKKACGKIPHELIPMDYGDPIPWERLRDNDVTLIDFSLQPIEEMANLVKVAKSITWIDHHRSAIKEWARLGILPAGTCSVSTCLEEGRAACELAWDYYFGPDSCPVGVFLLGRYDVWDHGADARVLPFQFGMRIQNTDPKSGDFDWDWLFRNTAEATEQFSKLVRDGDLLLKYQKQQDANTVAGAWFPLNFAVKTWQACNQLGKGSSFFDSVWDPTKYDGMLTFSWNGDVWNVGLYSSHEEVDCGAIAKQHGGGGHPGAAGFQCRELPFQLDLFKG